MCVLHVTSKNTLVEFLRTSEMPVYHSHVKGEVPATGRRKPWENYGFSCAVSDCEWLDLAGQIEDAYNFLLKYGEEIRLLGNSCFVDDIRLDFPYSCRLDDQFFMQCDYFPPKLLKLVGDLGIGIELSHYPAEGENSEPNA